MKASRWLLPFTCGLDMRALDAIVCLAENHGATLVAISLIYVSPAQQAQGARLEHIQQSKDFLEAVKWKAADHEVSLERYEVFTGDVQQSISLLAQTQHCDSVILVTSEQKDVLLPVQEMKHLLAEPPASLVLLRLIRPANRASTLYQSIRFLPWLRRPHQQQETSNQERGISEIEEPSWSKVEAHL